MATSRRGGGSRSTVATRRRNKGPGRKEAARLRVLEALGLEAVEKIRCDWLSWDTGRNGREWQQSDGVVMHLLQQGFSSIEIKAIIPVGDSRIHRLRGVINNGVQTLHTRQPRAPASHAVTESQLTAFKRHCDSTWELEDGFPCAHRLPRQYFTEPRIMWKTLHARYADDITSREPNARVINYSRFTQYVHFHYPGVRLTRSAEDVCDCCVRLKVQLSRDDLSEEERVELCKAKNMHLSAAIAQRRFVSTFIKAYVAVHAPHQAEVGDALPDVYDEAHSEPLVPTSYHNEHRDEQPATSAPPPIVLIQAEDFGGGISMPHYGHTRPSVDYFNSNLIIQNFVVADITNGTNYVYFYDERAQGKGADALCSLILLYHLTALHKSVSDGTAAPEISFSVLDNCVGQNKSRVVMMFLAFLSVVFPYKKVVLCFLLPGHSHNIADRVVAWCRGATRGQNLYTPNDLVKEVNNIHSVEGVFLNHNDSARSFFTDWGPLLSKYFAPPPPGYTSNYLFEFDSGVCTARALVDTSGEEAVTFAMVRPGMIDGVVHGVLHDLFGPSVTDIRQASIKDVQLPRHPVRELTAKNLASLSAKYFSIPPPFLGYYPNVPEATIRAGDDDVSQLAQTDTTTEPKKKVGRPRTKKPRLLPKQPSILQFFSKKTNP